MRYIVHTRRSICEITPQEPYRIISVITPGSEEVALRITETCRGILVLSFDDVDREVPIIGSGKTATLFDAMKADHILDFWSGAPKDVAAMYIHCDAGQCRSPAIAAALQKIETGSDDVWFATKRPNMLVYRTILERAHVRGLI